MQPNTDTPELTLAGLTRRCAQETEAFFRRDAYDPLFCYELFRRAVTEQNQRAFAFLYTQYTPLVTGWVERHPSFRNAHEEAQYFVNRAFEKFWRALSAEKFQQFSDLKALLSYLKLCTHSVLIDYTRTRQVEVLDEETGDVTLVDLVASAHMEDDALQQAARRDFWVLIRSRLTGEKEEAVIYGSFVMALKPAELQAHYAHLFADIKDVYRTKQNVLDRLRRDLEIQKTRADYL